MRGGHNKYVPTESDRNTVKAMAINGVAHDIICKCLGKDGIDKKTMYKHFRDELDNTLNRANSAITGRLYQMALAGNPPVATFFWLKCKGGWRERQDIEVTMQDPKAVVPEWLAKSFALGENPEQK